jgi:hypothetical protein
MALTDGSRCSPRKGDRAGGSGSLRRRGRVGAPLDAKDFSGKVSGVRPPRLSIDGARPTIARQRMGTMAEA